VIPWKWPLVVAALLVPIVGGFYVGGAGVGVAVGALVVVALVLYAANLRPRGPIVPAPSPDERRHVLFVATCSVEEPGDVERVAGALGLEDGNGTAPEVRVLAPARIRFLDRWASDVEGARRDAQRNLVATVAALAKAGVEAEARVGDEDVVQAVEDQLQTYPATEVVLVSGGEEDEDAAAELEARLEAAFSRVVI
jgi:hypothetical protein